MEVAQKFLEEGEPLIVISTKSLNGNIYRLDYNKKSFPKLTIKLEIPKIEVCNEGD